MRVCTTVYTCYLITVVRRSVRLGEDACRILRVLDVSLASGARLESLFSGAGFRGSGRQFKPGKPDLFGFWFIPVLVKRWYFAGMGRLDGVRLSLLFVFVISFSFTSRMLTLATAERCSVTAFSRATKGRQCAV